MYASDNFTRTMSPGCAQGSDQDGDGRRTVNERPTLQHGAGQPFRGEHWLPSDLSATSGIQAEIASVLIAFEFAELDIFAIRMAIEEALVNAIKHGNQMDPRKGVRVIYRIRSERFDISITDQGPGFDPSEIPDPTAPENLERPCGRGLLLIRHYMTGVSFEHGGNTIDMHKLRSGPK
jgi:serine/threonine-protein kinase RsbW